MRMKVQENTRCVLKNSLFLQRLLIFLMLQHPYGRTLYKILCVILLTYALLAGLLQTLPNVGGNLQQTSRNLFFHVPMWFTMYLMMALSVYWSIQFIRTQNLRFDISAREAAATGVFFGFLGLFTGSVWSRVTWGEALASDDPTAWWAWDPKQTMALIAVLIYLAYFLLRNSLSEEHQKAKIGSIYNIFAAASLIPLTWILPRKLGGLHPGGKEGSPLFDNKDISNDYRWIFYPAILGFMLLGLWLLELRIRTRKLEAEVQEQEEKQ